MNTITRMQNTAKVRKEIEEVATGARGFISHTKRKADLTGVPQENVSRWATAAGLKAINHGRFGLCFSK